MCCHQLTQVVHPLPQLTSSISTAYSRKLLRDLKFTIFAIQPNLQTFHFTKCSPLNRTRMLLNKIAHFSPQKVISNEITKFFRYAVVLKFTYVYVVKPPSFFKTEALNTFQDCSHLQANTSHQVCLFCTLA